MMMAIIPDWDTSERADRFEPYRSLPDINSPGELSGKSELEQEVVMNISNFIEHGDINRGNNNGR